MIYNQWILTQFRDAQSEKKSQNVFKRKKTVAASRKRNATIATLKSTMQMNVRSQEDCNKLLEWKENWSNEDRS